VLIELGFFNGEEGQYLNSEEGQNSMAESIASLLSLIVKNIVLRDQMKLTRENSLRKYWIMMQKTLQNQ
jgi:hypothetical protein